jgi:hypothetical protein
LKFGLQKKFIKFETGKKKKKKKKTAQKLATVQTFTPKTGLDTKTGLSYIFHQHLKCFAHLFHQNVISSKALNLISAA